MTREKALKASKILFRIEQLESQLDYIDMQPKETEYDLEKELIHETPSFGFSEEDLDDISELIKNKIKDKEKELELL